MTASAQIQQAMVDIKAACDEAVKQGFVVEEADINGIVTPEGHATAEWHLHLVAPDRQ